MMEKEKKKIIIDTDCGSDDAMAIAMALNDPTYEIQLITTVSGNVPVQQATINTLTTIEYAGTYEPQVYMGCEKMLLRELECAYETHGQDGMGAVSYTHLICTERNLIHYNRMTGKQKIKIFSRIALVKYRFSFGDSEKLVAKVKMRK